METDRGARSQGLREPDHPEHREKTPVSPLSSSAHYLFEVDNLNEEENVETFFSYSSVQLLIPRSYPESIKTMRSTGS
jgi:hypothetical protein